MFNTEGIPYPVRFANYQRNSHVPVETNSTGRLVWSKNYFSIDKTLLLIPLDVCISGDFLGVRSVKDLLVFTINGEFKYNVSIGENKPVVFGKEAYAYTKPSFQLEYRNFDGGLILESKGFPALKDFSELKLLKPSQEDFLAAIEYSGGPQGLPGEYDVYRLRLEESIPPWSFCGEGEIDYVLLLPDGETLLIIQGVNATLLNTSDGKQTGSFKIKMDEIENACLDLEGNLVMVGQETVGNASRPCLKVVALDGEQKWSYRLSQPKINQPPACGKDGRVYVINEMMLMCVAEGELLWQAALKSEAPAWLTVTANDNVICLNGAFLNLYNAQGESVFGILITEENETFDAPVAVDSNGRLYVAGGQKLYCFE